MDNEGRFFYAEDEIEYYDVTAEMVTPQYALMHKTIMEKLHSTSQYRIILNKKSNF